MKTNRKSNRDLVRMLLVRDHKQVLSDHACGVKFIGPEPHQLVAHPLSRLAEIEGIPARTLRHAAQHGRLAATYVTRRLLQEGETAGWYSTIWDVKIWRGYV